MISANALLPTPQEATHTGLLQANYWQTPPPTVIRASRALLEDEPYGLFLPKEFGPPGDSKLPSSLPRTQPAEEKFGDKLYSIQVQAPVSPMDKAATIDLDKDGKIFRAPVPSIVTPSRIIDTGEMNPEAHANRDQIILVDENGNPLQEHGNSPAPCWYGSAEWLLWRTRGFHLPPLVTTASPLDPPETRAAIGFGQTRVIFGDSTTSSSPRSGFRFTLGRNLDTEGLCGLETTFFFLGRQRDTFIVDSAQYPVLARPFFNINTGMQDRNLTTSPGLLANDINATGSIPVVTTSRLWGAEANARTLLWCGCSGSVSGLLGFRYVDLNETLSITELILARAAVPAIPGNTPIRAGDRITVVDDFHTHNQFYGGQAGILAQWQRGRWNLDSLLKLALGATVETVEINGSQSILSTNGQRQDFRGGLYALPSNIGVHTQSHFAVIPEVGLKVGYQLNENVRLFVGYDLMYWSHVLRPGDQIDQALDANQIPNSGAPFPRASQVRPIVPFRATGYWAQGVSAGLEFRY